MADGNAATPTREKARTNAPALAAALIAVAAAIAVIVATRNPAAVASGPDPVLRRAQTAQSEFERSAQMYDELCAAKERAQTRERVSSARRLAAVQQHLRTVLPSASARAVSALAWAVAARVTDAASVGDVESTLTSVLRRFGPIAEPALTAFVKAKGSAAAAAGPAAEALSQAVIAFAPFAAMCGDLRLQLLRSLTEEDVAVDLLLRKASERERERDASRERVTGADALRHSL